MSIYHTCESVAPGHPDKVADTISDSILDELLKQDKTTRAAIEVMVKSGLVYVAGEITTSSWCNIEEITRQCLRNIGYKNAKLGICADSCAIIQNIGRQSPDIAQGIENLGAGDQGFMVGYACDETPEHMPYGVACVHDMMRKHAYLVNNTKDCPLGPDAKCQVSLNYSSDNKAPKIESVILSSQHHEDVDFDELKSYILSQIIYESLPSKLVGLNTLFVINPAGRFVEGGPAADCGLTGRKLIVDTYGSYARHGGGAFSGKDPTKVDRSGAYAARYIANHLVTAGIYHACEVQISYAIGRVEPVNIYVAGNPRIKFINKTLINFIKEHFPIKPADIIEKFSLKTAQYAPLAQFGHFGRKDLSSKWDQIDEDIIELLHQKFH